MAPIDMVLHCPECGFQHIDAPNPARDWNNPPHRSHECQRCGVVWRPADVETNGVAAVQTRGRCDTWPKAETVQEKCSQLQKLIADRLAEGQAAREQRERISWRWRMSWLALLTISLLVYTVTVARLIIKMGNRDD